MIEENIKNKQLTEIVSREPSEVEKIERDVILDGYACDILSSFLGSQEKLGSYSDAIIYMSQEIKRLDQKARRYEGVLIDIKMECSYSLSGCDVKRRDPKGFSTLI